MSYPKYLVTYVTMDTALGSNVIWHAALALSICRGPNEPFEVVDSYGFYSQPSSTTNPVIRFLKYLFGISFDLTGSHGVLKREEMRYLDKGIGLHGLSFDVSQDQFEKLLRDCENEICQEQEAITELNALLESEGLAKEAITAYARYRRELLLAKERGSEPRLTAFNLDVAISQGLSTVNSSTCKSRALSLLEGIGIEKKYLECLRQNKVSDALPRYSGELLETLLLHSDGEQQVHTSKRTGVKTLFRAWEKGPHYDKDAHEVIDTRSKLYWTVPPSYVITDDKAFLRNLRMPAGYRELLVKYISELQQIENFLLKSPTAAKDEKKRNAFIKTIRALYQPFSKMNTTSGVHKLAPPMLRAKRFIDNIYACIKDDARADMKYQTTLKPNRFRLPLSKEENKHIAKKILKRYIPERPEVYTIM